MKVNKGFVNTQFILAFVGVVSIIFSVFFLKIKIPQIKIAPVIINKKLSTSEQTFSQKSELKIVPTKIPASPTPSPIPSPIESSIVFHIDDNGSNINDSSLSLNIKNENSGQEQNFKNESSSWVIKNINSGKYKFSISFPKDKYFNPEKKCNNCQNAQVVSGDNICGYIFDFHAGENVYIYCLLRTTQPLSNNSNNSNTPNTIDNIPPTTNISYPSQNGSITYKTDGKVCAIASAPSDNTSSLNEIQTDFRFDDGSWSGYLTGQAYFCIDSLSNGPHTLSYHSKDKAGNTEDIKTISFTVNISEN